MTAAATPACFGGKSVQLLGRAINVARAGKLRVMGGGTVAMAQVVEWCLEKQA